MTISTDLSLDTRRRLLSLSAVIATSFGVGLLFGVGYPLTALTFEGWQQPKWLTGLASAVPALGVLLALPLVPRLVARLGPVNAMVLGCLVGAIGFLALFLWQEPWAWIAIRFAMSAGLAVPWLTGETWINSVSRDETRGRVIAAYAIAFFLGFLFGPVVLGLVGLTGPLPFLAAALAITLAVVPIVVARKLAPPFHHDGAHNLLDAMRLAPTAMAGGFVGGIAEITCLSLIANVALAAGLPQEHALSLVTIMAAGGIILQFPLGWLGDTVPKVPLMLGVAAAFVLMALALPLALTNPVTASVLVFALGGTVLGFYTLSLAIIGERVPAGPLASVNVAFLIMYQIGAIAGPIISGIAMTASPVAGFSVTIAGLVVVCAAGVIYLERTRTRS